MRATLRFLSRNAKQFFIIFFVYASLLLIPIMKPILDLHYKDFLAQSAQEAEALYSVLDPLLSLNPKPSVLKQIVSPASSISILISKPGGKAIYIPRSRLQRGKLILILKRYHKNGYLVQFLVEPEPNLFKVLSNYLQSIFKLQVFSVHLYREIFGYHLACFFFIVSIVLLDHYRDFYSEED